MTKFNFQKLFTSVGALSIALGAIAVTSQSAQAADVRVFGEGRQFSLSTINNFYNSLDDVDSSIVFGELTANNLIDVELLWAVQPADSYTNDELDAMATFLGDGGRIAFMGEHGSFAPQENIRINEAIATLGGDISIINQLVDGGFRDATRVGGQILDHPLTEGVNTYNYAAFAPLLDISGNAESLMLGSDLNSVMMAYQNIGPGSIFVITDQNVWDNVNLNSNDNNVMFENLLSGDTGAPPVDPEPVSTPEPASLLGLLAVGAFGANSAVKRKKAVS